VTVATGLTEGAASAGAAAVEAGARVEVIPGPSAPLAALVGSGLPSDRFTFFGFPPREQGARQALFGSLRAEVATMIFFEAPDRVHATLDDLAKAFGAARRASLGRELTKIHEEFLRGPVSELRTQLATRPSIRGEIVLMLAPAKAESDSAAQRASIAVEVATLIKAEGISEMDALKRVARERGMGKSEAYRELQREQNRLR